MATLLCPQKACLRSLLYTSRASRFSPRMTAAFSIAATPQSSRRPSQCNKAYTRPTAIVHFRTKRISPTVRHASVAKPAASPSPSPQQRPEDALTWDRFFDLRRKRRWINLASSAVTSVTAVGVLAPVLASQDIDSWGAQISGLDPVVVLGITTFTVAAGGWLCGPTFGTAMFSLWAGRRGWNALIAEKEKSFFARIKRYRAEASSSSPQNPLPDYYGEKIGSVKDYRRWLKDQRAFNLKKNKNLF